MPKAQVIAFCGTQGSGKTTLMNEVSKYLEKNHHMTQKGYYLGDGKKDTSVSREAMRIGFSINQETTFDTQYYISVRYMEADLATRRIAMVDGCRWIIYDRTILDPIPYTNASNNIKPEYKLYIKNMLFEHLKRYSINHVFYVEPLKTIETDGIRTADPKFQSVITEEYSNLLEDMINTLNIKFTPIPADSIENRVKLVISSVLEKNI